MTGCAPGVFVVVMSQRQKEILTGVFGIVFYFGAFVSAELTFRAISHWRFGNMQSLGAAGGTPVPEHPGPRRRGFYRDTDSGLRLPYPDQHIGRVRINHYGFRGPDLTVPKPKNTVRLAFLGSSTTYDADVPEGKTWPEMTVRELDGALDGCALEMLNAGLPGFSTDHMSRYWRAVVRRFEVDVVVVLPGDMTNDVQTAAREAGFDKGQYKTKSWLATHSLLWEKIEKNVKVLKAQRNAFSERDKFQPDVDQLTGEFSQRLQELLGRLSKDNVYVAVPTIASHVRADMERDRQLVAADSALFYMPYLSIANLIRLQDRYNQTIRETVSARDDVLLIDGEDEIPADQHHFVDSRHFAPLGSAAMGQRVAEGLLSSQRFLQHIRTRAGCVPGAGPFPVTRVH